MVIIERFHQDELGEVNLATVLIVAFVVLPLLGLLIMYRDKIAEKASAVWDDVFGKGSAAVKGPS